MPDNTEAAPRRRGRPREFDPDEVLGRVETIFIEKGFSAASLDDLAGAADLNRPSLYAAFGDKEHLFLHTLQRYGERRLALLASILSREDPIEERLTAFYKAEIEAYCAPPHAPGCLITGAAAGAATGHPEIGAAAADLRCLRESALETAFARCVATKLLPPEPAPAIRAMLATAILDTLSARARFGERKDALEAFAQDALALVCMV